MNRIHRSIREAFDEERKPSVIEIKESKNELKQEPKLLNENYKVKNNDQG